MRTIGELQFILYITSHNKFCVSFIYHKTYSNFGNSNFCSKSEYNSFRLILYSKTRELQQHADKIKYVLYKLLITLHNLNNRTFEHKSDWDKNEQCANCEYLFETAHHCTTNWFLQEGQFEITGREINVRKKIFVCVFLI